MIKCYKHTNSFLILFFCLLAGIADAQPCTLSMTVNTTDSRCKATGSVVVSVANGSGNYNYLVSSSSYSTNTSSSVIGGLQPGVYSVKVKDISSGCTLQQDNIVVGGNYQDPRFSLAVTDATCAGAANGSLTVSNLQYGRAPFMYTIVAPSASQNGTSNTTGVFTGLTAGDYYVQLADSCGGLQTRVISIANYSWTPSTAALTKPSCDSMAVTIAVADNRGNSNTGSPVFNGFSYGVTLIPGDTVWYASRSFHFYKAAYRHGTFVIKDGCGNIQTLSFTDSSIPNVNATVNTNNYQCSDFTATVTGQQNLTSPQYCLYNSANALITCNTSGVFNNIAYGSYCIGITDNCYDTTFTRCFSVAHPPVTVAATIAISNAVCSGFDATVTGQQNLTSPQYCLYDSTNTLLSCNTTGVFTNIQYGPYCIYTTDGCTGTVITRCFTQRKTIPAVANTVSYSNLGCSTFTATISGQSNLVNPQYCLYDTRDSIIVCNTTGIFNNLAYGSYCLHVQNDPACYDTVIQRCFSLGAPVPSAGAVSITNNTCTGFTATVTGQANLNNPQYFLYDSNNSRIDSNATGQFSNLSYGAYCIQVLNGGGCYDTSIQRCFPVTRPVPAVGSVVTISNKSCNTFSAAITGQQHLTSPSYYLLDTSGAKIDSNATGVFNNINYGAYCIQVVNSCYDTSFSRCFTASGIPITVAVVAAPSCTISKTTLTVTVSNGTAPYAINVYNPWGMLVSNTNTNTASTVISGLPGLPAGYNYKVIVSGACSGSDSATVSPLVYTLTKSINANSKCPGGLWQNGSGDLLVNAQFSGGTITPSVISQDGNPVTINYTTQTGSNFTFSNMQPATYIIKYTLQSCGTLVYDTFALHAYTFPTLDKSAVYQCNNSNFSVNAAALGGIAPFTYEIIGSSPSAPSIVQAPQASPLFNIGNGTTYSLVRLRVTDACGNATINDAGILPLANTIIKASSDCYYNDISLTVDTIANATYTWYKKTSPTDSILVSNNQTHTIPNLLPSDTGIYVNVMSVNNGCLQKISTFHITGNCGGGLLGVNGLSFTASSEKETVQLAWTTVKRYDANSFAVERSSDGLNFQEIGRMTVSAGTTLTSSHYLFSDDKALTGKNYYRLRIYRGNGTMDFSNVELVLKKSKGLLSVMPNPVATAFTIRFGQDQSASYALTLVAGDGKIMLSDVYNTLPGATVSVQRPANMAPGIYYLVLINKVTHEKEIVKLFFK